MKTLYTVQRTRKNDILYGPTHGSKYAEETFCGLECDHNWFIINNTFDGEVTCKKCLKLLNEKAN
jgi:hypothetical protein